MGKGAVPLSQSLWLLNSSLRLAEKKKVQGLIPITD